MQIKKQPFNKSCFSAFRFTVYKIKAANPNATTINELEKINIEATLVAKVLKIVKDIVEAVTAED
nr:hypothetical protein [Spiroplasma sp. Moj]